MDMENLNRRGKSSGVNLTPPPPPPPHRVKARFHRKGKRSFSPTESGFSLTEALTAIGIITVLAGVAAPLYMKYLNTSRINQISLLAGNYFKAMETCLVVNDEEISRCNTKAKIKFDCDDCSAMKQHRNVTSRFSMLITKDKLSACAVYLQDCDRKHKLTLNKKVCAKVPGAGYSCGPFVQTDTLAILPLKVCSSNSDCSTGETCEKWTGRRGIHFGCALPLP